MDKSAPWDDEDLTTLSFRVDGVPQSKGSLTRMPGGQMIPAGSNASRQRKANWRTDCKEAALVAMDGHTPLAGPIKLAVRFELPYPTSTIRKWQMGWWPCMKKPDLDKLIRSLLDAFTHIIWVDDNQVTDVTMGKAYAWDGRTGAEVFITQTSSDSLRYQADLAGTIKGVLG
jgi:Holliday junction resolvase RusA-like endonuclease